MGKRYQRWKEGMKALREIPCEFPYVTEQAKGTKISFRTFRKCRRKWQRERRYDKKNYRIYKAQDKLMLIRMERNCRNMLCSLNEIISLDREYNEHKKTE